MDTLWITIRGQFLLKHKVSDSSLHGLFVDDKIRIYSCRVSCSNMILKSNNFEITGGSPMKTFLGVNIEQSQQTDRVRENQPDP